MNKHKLKKKSIYVNTFKMCTKTEKYKIVLQIENNSL